MLTCIFGTTHPSYCYMQTDGGTLSAAVLGQMSMRGEIFGLIPPNSISRRHSMCAEVIHPQDEVCYMLNAIVKLFQKSVQTRFLKLLGMLSTACKYRYQNIKKHSTLKNLVLEILVLYTNFNTCCLWKIYLLGDIKQTKIIS